MKAKSIEILKLVQKMQIETGKKKLQKQEVAKRMGMTRQGLNRYNDEVGEYISGKYPVELALKAFGEASDAPFDLLFEKHKQTVQELEALKEDFDLKLTEQKKRLVTSLMQDDILAHLSSNLRKDMEKQLLHNNTLTKQITELELELAAAKNGQDKTVRKYKEKKAEQVLVKIDLKPVFLNYRANKDQDIFDDEKDAAIEDIVTKVKRQLIDNKSPVVLFMDRYLCSFDKFVPNKLANFGDAIVVQLPLFDRLSIKTFLDDIACSNPLHIYIPVCDSKSLKDAQRKFFASSVPDIELGFADDEYIPSCKEGFSTVVMFQIEQGD